MPWYVACGQADRLIRKGHFVVQKWTCTGCRRRITANNVNYFTEQGHCQHCNHVTDIVTTGCGYTALFTSDRTMTADRAKQILGLTDTGVQ